MARRITNVLTAMLAAIFILTVVLGCRKDITDSSSGVEFPFKSFRDIPGVTTEEIAAIETLQRKYDSFAYGVPPSTEAFLNANNEISGYAALFCEWLTELFGIKFDLQVFEWIKLTEKLNSGEIDFSVHFLSGNENENLQNYFISDPIAERQFIITRINGNRSISQIARARKPRYAFIVGSPTEAAIASVIGRDSYESVWIKHYNEVYSALERGDADALITTKAAEANFIAYPDLMHEDFFPLAYSPISVITADPSFEVIISVLNKAMQNGAIPYLNYLYNTGYDKYRQYKFFMSLNDEEKDYLQNTSSVPMAVRHYNYPVVFYDYREEKWDGIAIEVLREAEEITGLRFEVVNSRYTELCDLMQMLLDGKAHIFSDLVRTESRESRFLWGDHKLMEDQYVLLSKMSFPNVNINQIPYSRIALRKGTAHTEMFLTWFPGAINAKFYESAEDAFLALENNEVDLLMGAKSHLLYYSNYYDFSAYKANYLFNHFYESAFAFNKDQIFLRSIVDKALSVINTNVIAQQWLTRTYDHRTRMLEARLPLLKYIIILALAVLVLLLIMLHRRHSEGKRLKKLVARQINEISEANVNTEKLVAAMDTLIMITNDKNDNIVFINEKMKKEFHAADNVIGKKCRELLYEKENCAARCSFCPKNNPVLNSGESVIVERFFPKISRHYKIINRYINWGGSRVFLQQFYDVTEVKKSIAKLHQTDKYTQLLLDALPMCCQLYDINFKMVDCNIASLYMYGFDNKHELIKKFMDHCSPEYQPDGQNSKSKALMLGSKIVEKGFDKFEWMHQNLKGEPIPTEITLVRVKHRDGFLIAAYNRDLREQRAYLAEIEKTQENLRYARDAAESASKAKSTFLANMSHEIRTPMNSILGFAELAQFGSIPAKTKEYLVNISESATWLLKIINDILDISKIESGKIMFEHIPFDLHDVISHCQSVIKQKVEEKGISLYCYAEPSIAKKLLGDPVRLRQALLNLLTNAVKFTNSGTVKLLASVVKADSNTITINFEVKDSGIGMDSGQIARIFEPFMQADSSITRRFGGTGLGLPITKNIVEMMGGTLQVESAIGIGSKFGFVLTFGLIDITADKSIEVIAFNNFEKPDFIGEILVCDDNAMNQQVLCDHLSRIGIKAIVADNGKEGVDIVIKREQNNEKPFDLIFMDIHMPVMDGLEAASKITAMKIKTPIVAVTANIMSNDLTLYKSSGMSDCLGKPFTSHELWKCLIKYLPVKGYSAVDTYSKAEEEQKTLNQLQHNFVKNNQTTYEQIIKAADAGDIKLAHRLAHTLKSNAGLIGETHLQEIAAAVEAMFSKGENMFDKEKAGLLEAELKSVLEELAPLLVESEKNRKTQKADEETTKKIIEKLEPMLIERNPQCVNMIDDIRTIPGTEELMREMEKFRFKQAISELKKIKKEIGMKLRDNE